MAPNPAHLREFFDEAKIRLGQASQAYAAERASLVEALRAGGLDAAAAAAVVESYEAAYTPEFGLAAKRGETDRFFTADGSTARRAWDAAARAGVPSEKFARFTAALADFRGGADRAFAAERILYSATGAKGLAYASAEAADLDRLRQDIVTAALTMNPRVQVEAAFRLVDPITGTGAADGSWYDPVRRIAAVALDPASFNPRQEIYKSLWGSIEDILDEKEIKILNEEFRDQPPERRMEAAAAAFAVWAAPEGTIRKPKGRLEEVFAPVGRFFGRVRNFARGHGFQVTQDLWRRAKVGNIAMRADFENGIRIPAASGDAAGVRRKVLFFGSARPCPAGKEQPSRLDALAGAAMPEIRRVAVAGPNAGGYERIAASLKRLSAVEIRRRIAVQNDAILEAKRARGLFGWKKSDLTRLDELMRGRQVLLKIERERREQDLNAIIDRAAPPPATPTPFGPPPRPFMRGVAAGDGPHSPHAGSNGAYVVASRPMTSAMGDVYPFGLDMNVGGGRFIPAAAFMVPDAADSFSRGLDAATPTGTASPHGQSLAAAVNEEAARVAGPDGFKAALRSIRASGLIDADIDRHIESRDLYAFVYPLTTGDILYRDGETWRAGSMAEFKAFAAERGDRHDRVAADVISLDDVRRRAAGGNDYPPIDRRGVPDLPATSPEAPPRRERPVFRPVVPDTATGRIRLGQRPPEGGPASPMGDMPRAAGAYSAGILAGADAAAATALTPALRETLKSIGMSERAVGRLSPPEAHLVAGSGIFCGNPENSQNDVRAALKDLNDGRLSTVRAASHVALKALAGDPDPGAARLWLELNAGVRAMDAEMKARGLPMPSPAAKNIRQHQQGEIQ